MRPNKQLRRGATIVEFAILLPITLTLVVGVIVGGLGIFRYQQVAHLAREASRWAAVHGTDYARETGNPVATAVDVYKIAIAPKAAGLDLSQLTYSVTWNTNQSPSHDAIVNGKNVSVTNTVTVTVTYHWIPEAFLGSIDMSSNSTSVIFY